MLEIKRSTLFKKNFKRIVQQPFYDEEEFKKVITQEINDIIAEWNTGKYTTLKIGTGDAIFNGAISEITQERTPKLYKFLQSEWNRLLSAVNKTS